MNERRDEDYEIDVIPIKRSKKSESVRSEARMRTAGAKRGADFSITPAVTRDSGPAHAAPAKTTARPVTARPVTRTAEQSAPAATRPAAQPRPAATARPAVQARPAAQSVPATRTAPAPRPAVRTVSAEQPAPVRKTPVRSVPEYPVQEHTTPRQAPVQRTVSAGRPAPEHRSPSGERTVDFRTERKTHTEYNTAGVPILHSVYGGYESSAKKPLTAGTVVRRTLLSIGTLLLAVVVAVLSVANVLANGPSETARNKAVLMAMQVSATKWAPGIFLDKATVDGIVADSLKLETDVVSIDEYYKNQNKEQGGESGDEKKDKWENAIDGMLFETVKGPTFKGYVLQIKDPSRVKVGTSASSFSADSAAGMRIFELADKYNAVAAINGGEYPDNGGVGTGGRPIGLTYADGVCLWNDGSTRTFMGFDQNNKLIVRESMTKAEADALGIRDGVSFQTGNTLISNDNGEMTFYRADANTGMAQRTAIGQAADGTVILIVTDGRTASSLGATHNDIIDLMVQYGAISAGMLDGGSSSLMYYRDYFDKYPVDKSQLDEYQQMGLVNKYKAFTTPRRIPTVFMVTGE